MKKNCTKPMFSSGSQCAFWMDANCDSCQKGSRYNEKNDTYTKMRCSIQIDIFTQYMGTGCDAVRQKSYDATRNEECPYKTPLGTKRGRKRKPVIGQTILFEL